MTEDEFKAYLCADGVTWADLAAYLTVVPCDCGEPYCKGWQAELNPDYREAAGL